LHLQQQQQQKNDETKQEEQNLESRKKKSCSENEKPLLQLNEGCKNPAASKQEDNSSSNCSVSNATQNELISLPGKIKNYP